VRSNIKIEEKYLTVRWNNLIMLGLGIPALVYGIIVLTTPALSDFAAFVGILFFGVLY